MIDLFRNNLVDMRTEEIDTMQNIRLTLMKNFSRTGEDRVEKKSKHVGADFFVHIVHQKLQFLQVLQLDWECLGIASFSTGDILFDGR